MVGGITVSLSDLTSQDWLNLGISAVVVALAAIAGRWLVDLVIRRVGKSLTRRTTTRLDDLLLGAIRVPLAWFLVVFVAGSMVARLDFLPARWAPTLENIFFVLYFLVGFTLAWRLLAALFEWYADEMTGRAAQPALAQGLALFFRRVALIVLALIGLIVLLSHFGADITGLVATLGVGSLAIALAAQAAFEDAISGFIIMIDQPFRVGDRIEILDLNTWGDVVDIGLRSSRIRTRDNRMVIVPNSVLGKSLVVNHAYPDSEYRIETDIGLAYGTDVEHARQTLIEAVKTVDGVLLDHPVEALLLAFGDSALMFRVRWWIESYVDTRRMFDAVHTAIYQALNAEGISIPFPQRDVHHRLEPSEAARLGRALRGE